MARSASRLLAVVLSLWVMAEPAVAQSVAARCAELYMKRNAFYNRKGLCFTRDTALEAFPNNPATCHIYSSNNLPISANEKRWVDSIVAEERMLGCPRLP